MLRIASERDRAHSKAPLTAWVNGACWLLQRNDYEKLATAASTIGRYSLGSRVCSHWRRRVCPRPSAHQRHGIILGVDAAWILWDVSQVERQALSPVYRRVCRATQCPRIGYAGANGVDGSRDVGKAVDVSRVDCGLVG